MTNPYWAHEYVLTIGVALTLLSGWSGWVSSHRASSRIRVGCVGLRMLGGTALTLLALNPGRWDYPAAESLPAWYFLTDRSRSMAEKDCGGRSRWDEACRRVGDLAAELPEEMPVRAEVFADRRGPLKGIDNLAEITPTGTSSDITGSLAAILRSHLSTPDAIGGIVLATDGIQVPATGSDDVTRLALALDVPVYAVCLGGEIAIPDLDLRPERVTVPAFINQPLRIPFHIKATGLGRVAVDVQIRDDNGALRATVPVRLEDGVGRKVVAQCSAPETAGYTRFHLTARVFPGETRTLNNQLEIGVQVLDSAMNVLMIEGLPHWDSKFLAQLLRARDYIQLTEIYRLGPSRYYRIDPGGEKMDQEGPGMFPDSIEKLAAYDAVILGKGIDAVLSPAQAAVLSAFVAERGGALIFARGRPWRSPFPELARLEPVVWGDKITGRFAMLPTAEGAQAGLFGEKLPEASSQVWGMLPAIDQLFEINRVKPFTRVLAETPGEKIPLLISRRFGRGMVVTVNAEGLWQWDFFPHVEESRSVYREFWPLLVQWALTAADFPPGCDLAARVDNPVVRVGDPVEIAVLARTADSVPPGAAPRIEIYGGKSDEGKILSPRAATGVTGRWTAAHAFETPGLYEIRPGLAPETPVAGTGVEVLPLPAETDHLSANREFLRSICDRTGGRLLDLNDPSWPPASLTDTVNLLGSPVWKPMWDRGWWLGLVCFFLCFEWYLRRRNMLS
ncbi:MAG: hypothetical protein RRC34_13115 [Lentisphaeria bacterium]|nr:hypothetical protein [Lentisphaeria bacterium]